MCRMINQFIDERRVPRKRTSMTIRPDYLQRAKELGINTSAAAEQGVGDAIHKAETAKWIEENREAIKTANDWVAANELPLAGKRLF